MRTKVVVFFGGEQCPYVGMAPQVGFYPQCVCRRTGKGLQIAQGVPVRGAFCPIQDLTTANCRVTQGKIVTKEVPE